MSGRAADGVFHWVAVALVALAVAALTIGLYDIEVRQPRTPRLAVVDIARLFVVAEQRGKQNVLAGAARNELPAGDGRAPSRGDPDSAGAALAFGGRVETVLKELSTECRCAVVAMAAVFGGADSVPDYTQEAARRLGLVLPPSDAKP